MFAGLHRLRPITNILWMTTEVWRFGGLEADPPPHFENMKNLLTSIDFSDSTVVSSTIPDCWSETSRMFSTVGWELKRLSSSSLWYISTSSTSPLLPPFSPPSPNSPRSIRSTVLIVLLLLVLSKDCAAPLYICWTADFGRLQTAALSWKLASHLKLLKPSLPGTNCLVLLARM